MYHRLMYLEVICELENHKPTIVILLIFKKGN
jgi:hypothetical protein